MSLPFIQIVIVKPDDFLHSETFTELADTLYEGFKALGAEARIVVNNFDFAAANLVLGWHLLTEAQEVNLPPHCILYNLEQMSEQNQEMCGRLIRLSGHCEIWDYSFRNIMILHQSGFPTSIHHVPIGTMPALTRISPAAVQDIDVLFYGSGNQRRAKILEDLIKSGLRVEWVFGVYGKARDSLIARAKVVLNLHFYDTKIFEMVRVSYLWANRKAVVAECHASTELEEGLEGAARYVPYENLVDACKELVADTGARKNLEERGFEAMSARRETDILSRVLAGDAEVQPMGEAGDLRISLVVNTRNEELNLPGLLACCRDVDEIIVADMESTDRTVEIAREMKVKILSLPNSGCCEPGRQPALDAANGDWILVLDADERVPPGTIHRLRELAVSAPPDVGGYSFGFHVFLGRTRVHATGWEIQHERHPRFFRRGKVIWPSFVHAVPVVTGRVRDIPEEDIWVDHYNFLDIAHFLDKVNRYSTIEAVEMQDAGKVPSVREGLLEGMKELVRRYTPGEDGALSLALGLGILSYKVANYAKLSEAAGWPAEPLPSKTAMACAVAAFSSALLADTISVAPRGVAESLPTASIIIPVFNKVDYTQKCLERLLSFNPNHSSEIIIIDNGSSDGTASFLAGLGEAIRVITNTENRGFVEACNQGGAASRGRYLVFLNNDTTPEPGWLDALVEMLDRDPSVGAAGSRLIYPDGRLQEAGGLIFNDGSGWNFGRFDNPSLPVFSVPCEVDYCSGAALMVRRNLFERLGGFDLRFAPAYYEDTDLCFGIRSLGFKVMYCPASTVIHFEGVTAGTDLSTGFKRYQAINCEKFASKWAAALAQQDPPPSQTGRNPVTADRRRLISEAKESAPETILPPPAPDAFHVLVVDPFLPLFDRAAGSLRLFRIVQLFRALGCRVTYVARNGAHHQRYKHELERFGVRVFAGDPDKLAELGYSSDAPRVELEQILTDCDLAWLSFYDVAEQYLPDIRRLSPETFIAVDTVDVHFLRERRQAELAKDADGLQKAGLTRERELKIYDQADLVVTVTQADAEVLREAGLGSPTAVVPTIHLLIGETPGWEARRDLVFVGNFNHTPNIDAALWFCREILPKVQALRSDIQLSIIGPNPPPEVQALTSPSVSVLGWVPDTAPHLDAARISVAPLRAGAGMKGKVGEALSRGIPVVTTTIGAEGMDLQHGQTAMVADDANRFAEAIVRLYEDQVFWEAMAQAGREVVHKRYSLESVGVLLQDLLTSSARPK